MIFSRHKKVPLLLFAAIFGFSGFQLALRSLKPENTIRKDFTQEYLMARAILAGVNPYQPLPELGERFQIANAKFLFPHPTPHTPAVAIASLPFAFFGYLEAIRIWFAVEIVCLLASVFLLLRWFKSSIHPLLVIAVTWTALGWSHIWEDLILGQLNIVLLLLIVGAWLNLRSGRQVSGGALLGAAISFKLIFWPLVLLLALRRRWVSAIATLGVFVIVNLMAALAMGWRAVADYYLNVGPSTAALYRAFAHNLSLWSIGWRIFTGTWSPALTGPKAPPLLFSTQLAVVTSLFLTGSVLIAALAASAKAGKEKKDGNDIRFDLAYGMMICVCLLISPLTWPHYLVLTALPLAIAARSLYDSRFPRREMLLGVSAIALLLIPNISLERLIISFPTEQIFIPESGLQPDVPVPFAAGLLGLIPILGVLILTVLLRRLSLRPADVIDEPDRIYR
jgi:hypothetical protein